jgi:uncharacterized Zn-finger protein
VTHHERTHSEELPHACELPGCGFRTRHPVNLRAHLRTHSQDRPYACTVVDCGYAAKTSRLLRMHARAVHGEGECAQCPHCDFRSGLPRTMQEHVNAHLGIRPHRCETCGFASTYRNHLQTHSKRCTGAAPQRKLLVPELAVAANLELAQRDELARVV